MAPLLLYLSVVLLSSLLYYLLFSKNNKDLRAPLPPGPRGWPILGNLPQLGSKPHQTFCALSKVYGPLFLLRFGSADVIVAASAAASAPFLKTHDVNFSNRSLASGPKIIAYNHQDLAFAPYGPQRQLVRKICAVHLFSPKALDDLCPVRAMEAVALGRALYARACAGCAVNLGQVLYECTTNVISMAILGRRVFKKEESNATVEFKEMVLESMKLGRVFNVGDFMSALRWLDPQCLIGKMKKLHWRFDSLLNKAIEEVGGGDDMLSVLLRLKEDGDGDGGKITNTNIKALLLMSLVAFSAPFLCF